ncbi:MAG: hypothetical protein ACTSPI_02755 [Candidatus Heimdallarchaeaceae archaeon]
MSKRIDKIIKNLSIRSINLGRIVKGEKGVLWTKERKEGLRQVAEVLSELLK